MSFYIEAGALVPKEPSDIVVDIDYTVFHELNMIKASKPIKCYKVVRRNKIGPNVSYHLPIGNMEIPEECIKDGSNIIANDEPKITVNRRYYPEVVAKVDRGFISTLTSIDDAKEYADYLKRIHNYKHLVLVECVIPKGEMYTKGVDDFGHKAYISKLVSVVEQVEDL